MENPVWWMVTLLANRDQALQLARGAVEERLAACGQVEGPIHAVYRWKGQVQEATEFKVVFKTGSGRREVLRRWIREHHPYEVPEILGWPAKDADPDYARWVEEA